ncbi:MAG: lipopolysaccharide transport system ATP-binding protein [Actinomycetota bacterium]|jgi:ABC-type polysaccharide/polyol phosphate transport system ATPase subunit|nr:lipopolysaccharide transport system ATP-binding protein [Actinomycetota bacterium]
MASIEIDHLWQGYHGATVRGWRRRGEHKWALRDVSLHVDAGEMVGVIGGNGSGKTTLLQTVAGVIVPLQGTVAVSGRVSSLVELSAGFHRELTGEENLLIGGVILGIPRREVRASFDEIVAFSGLSPEALRSPLRTYSAGMGLRLGFSLVAHSNPDVLLVDEVLAVGDDEFRARCVERVHELRRGGCGVLIVSHDLDLVRAHCHRALLLAAGEAVAEGPAGEVVDRYLESA